MGKQKPGILSVPFAALMLSLTALPVSAAAMQLAKTTGAVTVKGSSGRGLTRRDGSDPDSFIPASPAGPAPRGDKLCVRDGFARRVLVVSRTA